MIQDVSVFFVGHTDMLDCGMAGTPADLRRYSNRHLAKAYSNGQLLAKQLERLGYDRLWIGEHHFAREGYECVPNTLMFSLWLASQTESLEFGCGFNILPNWHPLRLAEDYSMADILTKGRVVLGVGRGYQTREVESFGSPAVDREANFELFTEQFDLLNKALLQSSFVHNGKSYSIPSSEEYRGKPLTELTLVPRPIYRDHEIWMPIGSGQSVEFMVKNDVKGMVTLNGINQFKNHATKYQSLSDRAGISRALGENLCLGIGFYIADSKEDAIELLRPYHDERYKWAAPLGYVKIVDENGNVASPSGQPATLPTLEEGVRQKAWLVGTPDDIIQSLKQIEEMFPGLKHLMLHWPEGMPFSVFSPQIELFASEVMPWMNGLKFEMVA